MDSAVYAPYQPEPGGRNEDAAAAVVREAVVGDVPACLDLVERVLHLDRGPWEKSLTESVTDPERMFFVAELDGRLAGYARATRWTPPDDAPPNAAPAGWYLLGLVVAPECRRRGIGRALTLARLEAVAGRAAEIWYFANARNRSSLDLHAELGFAEVTRDFWFPGLTFDGGVGVLARLGFTGDQIGSAQPGRRIRQKG